MPLCGIGADRFKTLVTGDPVGSYETFAGCVAAIMKKNPSYTKEQAEGTCGEIYKETKKKDAELSLEVGISENALKILKALAEEIVRECDAAGPNSSPTVYNILPETLEAIIMKSVGTKVDDRIKGLLAEL